MRKPSPEERALRDLAEAVARISQLLRLKPEVRDAMIAVRDPALRVLTTRIVAGCGFRIFMTDTGQVAAATAAGRPFDLLLLEAQDDTHHALRRIRALPEPLNGGAMIVLNVTKDAHWRELAAEAGADALLPWPATSAALIETIILLIGAQAPDANERAKREA
jgi:CheY-like chemotaxis protein